MTPQPSTLNLGDLPRELSPRLKQTLRENTTRLLRDWRLWFFALPSLIAPDQWAEQHVIFREQEVKGRCDFTGRNYLRRPIRDNARADVREQTLDMGRGNGKTIAMIIGLMWKIKYLPCRSLTIFPATNGEGGSRNFVSTRFIPDLEATPELAALFPEGQARFSVNKQHVTLGGAHLGFIGSNSAGQVVGNRLADIRMDEKEKFKMKLGNEAGTADLVKGSTEGVAEFQVFNTSTPSIESGLIWRDLLRSDFKLRFLPCPECNPGPHGATEDDREIEAKAKNFQGWFILAWSERFSPGLPRKFTVSDPLLKDREIPMAFVHWPRDCQSKSGDWDLQAVKSKTYFECPHCKGQIRDIEIIPARRSVAVPGHSNVNPPAAPEHGRTPNHDLIRLAPQKKNWMDANGFWLATRDGEPRHSGYQISSLYAPVINEESTVGGRAVKFLTAVAEGGEAIRNFINAFLALPEAGQQHALSLELGSRTIAQPDWVTLLTADFHKNWPYIWFIARRWCAFKLLSPFTVSDGLPDFVEMLDDPENLQARENCLRLLGLDPASVPPTSDLRPPTSSLAPIWFVIAELMRFDSRTGTSPIVEFLLAQKITGDKLVKFFHDRADRNTMEFRRQILLAMAEHEQGVFTPEQKSKFRPPRGGDSELIAAGHLDLSGESLWLELRDLITEFAVGKGMPIPQRCVAIDCGFAEKFNREVLQKCFESATQYKFYDPMSKNNPALFYRQPIHGYCQPCPMDGWFALRGKPTNRPLGDGKINRELATHVEDPYYGSADAGSKVVEVLEIPASLFWLRKNDLRLKRTKQLYALSPAVSFFPKIFLPDGTRTAESNYKFDAYERQINEQYYDEKKARVEPRHGRSGQMSRAHPYHLDDCETYQVALATHHEFFDDGSNKT